MGKGRGGEEWEGKGVAFKAARKDRKRKAAAMKKGEGASHPGRAKRRRMAQEAKAARTRTDDRADVGATTTPTNERGTSYYGRSLPSLDVGGSPGAPAFQSSPIPLTSVVRPRLKKNQKLSKTFVFQRENLAAGTNKTFIIRHGGRPVTVPPLQKLFRPKPKEHGGRKEATDKGRGEDRRVGFKRDSTLPAPRDQQEKKAVESKAAAERQKRRAELDALCPPRALSPLARDVRVTDAGGVGPWEAEEAEKRKRKEQERGPRVHDVRRRREEERKKEAVFKEKEDREKWDELRRKFDEERKERKRKEEDDERKKRMRGEPRERQQAANLCRIVADHYDDHRVEDLRDRLPRSRHVAPLYPPTHDADRREAAAKLARLEKLDREMKEEARRAEEEKVAEKERIRKEMERQRDILLRIEDDQSRGNSTHSHRDSSWKASGEERRPPGYSPGTTLTPTSAPLRSTRPSRQETLKRQEIRPKERKTGEPPRRCDSSNDRRRRR